MVTAATARRHTALGVRGGGGVSGPNLMAGLGATARLSGESFADLRIRDDWPIHGITRVIDPVAGQIWVIQQARA